MSLYVDLKFLNAISHRLEGFVQKNNNVWNCKCSLCGDSKKKKSKKRGFFYEKGGNLFYKCFNCEVSTTFYKFLEQFDGDVAREYAIERFASGASKHGNFKAPEIKTKKPVFAKKTSINLPSIADLPDDNIARKYVISRKLPKASYKDLYYAEDFKKFIDEIYPENEKNLIDNDPRLIIPFRSENGSLFAVQGRSLSLNPIRYITVKLKNELKLFGLDRINKKEKIMVVEGPLDALLLKNAVATADSNLAVAEFLGKDNIVLVNDNEPRNPQIVKQIKKYIDNGFTICLFPETIKYKDINDMVLGGMSKVQVQRIIDQNTFSGIRAEFELNKWKKV